MTRLLARARAGGDRAATLVEFALVVPLIFLLFGGMLDVGLAVLGSSVATGSARDGARIGIVAFDNADVVANASYIAIETAVKKKLSGIAVGDPATTGKWTGHYVEVRCLNGTTKAAKSCARAGIQQGVDLLEVTVAWKPISISGGLFKLHAKYRHVTRMVIIGDGVPTTPLTPCTDCVMRFNPNVAATTETNTDSTVTLTVTRTGSLNGYSSAGYTFSGTATGILDACAPGADYVSNPGTVSFAAGETSQPLVVTICGDTATEVPQTIIATLTSAGAIGGTVDTTAARNVAIITVADDDLPLPPVVATATMVETTGSVDGFIDRVDLVFNKAVTVVGCNAKALEGTFSLSSPPTAGMTINAVTVSGTSVTVGVSASGTANTAAGSFSITYSGTCLRDANTTTVQVAGFTKSVADGAGPVLLTASDTGGTTDGLAQAGDSLTLTFSEAIAAGLPSNVNVVLTASTISIPGVLSPTTVALNPKTNFTNSCTKTFPSTVTSSAANKTVTVTLRTPNATPACTVTAGESNGVAFAPDAALKDAASPTRNAATAKSTPYNPGNKYKLF
jgi:hypothetical protein